MGGGGGSSTKCMIYLSKLHTMLPLTVPIRRHGGSVSNHFDQQKNALCRRRKNMSLKDSNTVDS